MNLLTKIMEHSEVSEPFRGLNTIYELQALPRETVSEKITLAITIMKIINGIDYSGIFEGMEKQSLFNERLFNQSLADAGNYRKVPQTTWGCLREAFRVLIHDINLSVPVKPNWQAFDDAVADGTYDFEPFLTVKLNDYEKESVAKRKEEWNLTGQADVDWKVSSHRIDTEDGDVIELRERADVTKLKNNQIEFAIEKLFKEGKGDSDLKKIYDNCEVLIGQSRRPAKIWVLTAILFNQTFDKYPWLVKSEKIISEYLSKDFVD